MDYAPSGSAGPSAVYRHTACASIGMVERMWRDRDRERHTISGAAATASPIQVLTVLSVTSQTALSLSCLFVYYTVPWGFSVCHHRLQLADVPGVGERNQPVVCWPAGILPAVQAAFSVRCSGWQATQTDMVVPVKNPPASRQCFINARTGVPQCGQQHLARRSGT